MVSELRTNLFNMLVKNIPNLAMSDLMATEEFLRNSLKMIESVKLMRMALEPSMPEIKIELSNKDIKIGDQQEGIVEEAEPEENKETRAETNQGAIQEIPIAIKINNLNPDDLKTMQLIPTRNINPQKSYSFIGIIEDINANLYGECKNCINSCHECWNLNPKKSRQIDPQAKRPKAGVFCKCQIRFLNGSTFTTILFNQSAAALFNLDLADFIELIRQDGIQQLKQLALGRPIRFICKMQLPKNESISERAEFIDWNSIIALTETVNNQM